jgi:hypothetical protein
MRDAFRDATAEWELDLKIEPCPPLETIDPTLPPAARSAARKTDGLKLALAKYGFDGLIAGIRRDEKPPRKSVLAARVEGAGTCAINGIWDQFNASPPPGARRASIDPALDRPTSGPTPARKHSDHSTLSLVAANAVAGRRHHQPGGIQAQRRRDLTESGHQGAGTRHRAGSRDRTLERLRSPTISTDTG